MADQNLTIEFDFRGKRYKEAQAGLEAFAKRTGRLLEPAVASLSGTIRWYLTNVAAAMAKRHGNPYPSGTTAKTLATRSGKLVQSIKDSVRVEGSTIDDLQGMIGANVVYARIQEFGGTIVPKTSKYLAIPLPAALNANGTPIRPSARDWTNTFVARSKAGNLIIFQKRAGKAVPLYVLKSKVYIPPRLGLGDTIRTGMGLFTDRAMSDMLKAIKQQS